MRAPGLRLGNGILCNGKQANNNNKKCIRDEVIKRGIMWGRMAKLESICTSKEKNFVKCGLNFKSSI